MSRGIRLHARDVEVLELLADRRVETLNALHERLWPHCNRKSAYNRLGALARAGYLEHVIRTDGNPAPSAARPASQHIYLLGPKAPTALRIRNRDTNQLVKNRLNAALIDHQLATNRVADWIGTRLLTEHEVALGTHRKTRPDGAYRTTPDDQGRHLVLVEVDLGHYSRARILDKFVGFIEHPEARSIMFATPTEDRADDICRWIREIYSPDAMRRVNAYSFEELKSGVRWWEGEQPLPDEARPADPDWMRDILGDAGCE